MRAFIVLLFASLLTFSALAQSPAGVSGGLAIWLKANSGPEEAVGDPAEAGDALTRWLDVSGNNRHYTVVAGPTLAANQLNFNPGVSILSGGFDAPAGSELGNDWTIFTVSYKLASDQDGRVFDGHTGNYLWSHWGSFTNSIYINGNPSNFNSGIATTTGILLPHIHAFKRTNAAGSIEARADGTSLATFTGTNTANGIRIDIDAGAFAAGESSDAIVAEVIVYSTALTSADVLKVESYLALKYGLMLTHNYQISDGTTVWNTTTNAAYNSNVAGVGRDDGSALDQRQSKTSNTNAVLTVDKGAAFTTDNSFLVWGDNNLTGTSFNIPTGYISRASKLWKASVTGTPGNVNLSFNLALAGYSATSNASSYVLLKDTDNDFSSGSSVAASGGSVVSGVLTFSNVAISDNDIFTLAIVNTNAPGGISAGLNVWLKANNGPEEAVGDPAESGDVLTRWLDNTPAGNHYVVAGTPTLQGSTLNFNPSVEILSGGFDAPAGSELGADMTAFFISRKLPSDNNGRIFEGHTSNYLWAHWGQYTNSVYYNGTPSNYNSGIATTSGIENLHLHAYTRSSAGPVEARADGTSLATFPTSNSPANIRIDINNGTYSSGFGEDSDSRIGEMIVYNTVLSSGDINKIESYLAIKYGVPLAHNYISTDGTVIWDIAANAGYNNDIAGIGRDDITQLDQPKSTSVNVANSLIVDKGATLPSDKTYLIWGHNNQNGQSSNVSSSYSIRAARTWKVQTTGTPGDVSLTMNLSSINFPNTGSAANYVLLLDADGDFSSGATAHTTGASLVSGVLSFTNVPLTNGMFFSIAAVSINSPGGVIGVALWLKADNGVVGATDVSQWTDQSGYAVNATQGTVAQQPTPIATDLNFNPSVEFVSTDNLSFASAPANLNSTVFAVATPTINSTWRTMFRGTVNDHPLIVEAAGTRLGYYDNDAGGFKASGFTWLQSEPALVALEMRTGDVNFRKNGTQGSSITTISLTGLNLNYLGNYQFGGQPFGRISEVLIFNSTTPLTAQEKERIESYMAIKYGITLTHDYTSSNNTILWNAAANSAYNNNITAIGRDDLSTLDQRKSISVNSGAALTIDKGGAFGTDRSFIIVGGDNAAGTSFSVPSGYTLRTAQVWKSGVSGTPGAVTFNLNLATIGLPNTGNASDYALLLDSDADFTAGASAHTTGASIVGTTLTFTGVSFTNDGFFAVAVANVPLPGGVPGMQFWVKGDAGVTGTTNVSQWFDQSGNLNHAAQGVVASQPALVTSDINFNPTINFSASAHALTLTSAPNNLNRTVFVIAKPNTNTFYRTLLRGSTVDHPILIDNGNTNVGFWDNDGGGFKASGFTWTSNEVALLSLEMRTGDVNFRKNGTQGASITTINATSGNLSSLGNTVGGGQNFGRVAEVMIFNTTSALSTAEKQRIESYLAIKYGVTLTHDYVASDNTTLWNVTTNAAYSNNIAAIGRDDNSALDQRKSTSSNSTASLTIDNGAAFVTNKDFIIVGDNTSSGPSTNIPTGYVLRTAKIYKAAVTGTPGAITVSFNLSVLGLPATGLATDFVILKDTDTDFSTGATVHSAGATLVGSTLSFTGVSLTNDQFFTVASSSASVPAGISGAVFWVKGDVGVTGTTNVSAWADQSPAGNNVTQGTLANQPTLVSNSLNSHAVIDYNVNIDLMNFGTGIANLNSTVFAVGIPKVNTDWRTLLRSSTNDHQILVQTGGTTLGYYDADGGGFVSSGFTWLQNETAVVGLEMRTGNVNFRKNGTQGSSIATINLTGQNINFLGNYTGGTQAFGKIAETIIYNTTSQLTTSEKERVESYLAIKYGVTLTHNYLSTSSTVVWDATANATFHNEVAGIGRDDVTSLDQRKSVSVNTGAVVTMDLGGAFPVDKSFLIWGNNTGALSSASVTDFPAGQGVLYRLARVWKVANTGTVGPVTITFDLSGVPGSKTAADLRLLVDRNLNGVFADETTAGSGVISGATSLGAGRYSFSGVSFNDGEQFTIGSVNAGTPLPITLENFSAIIHPTGVLVNWSTLTEINNDFFTIERSTDGAEFETIARIQGAGNSKSRRTYSHIDDNPLPGKTYYRLKQTDFDGTATFSKVVSVNYGRQFKIYPNPARQEITIQGDISGSVKVLMTNVVGQQFTLAAKATSSLLALDVSSMPRGVYILCIQDNNELVYHKVVLE